MFGLTKKIPIANCLWITNWLTTRIYLNYDRCGSHPAILPQMTTLYAYQERHHHRLHFTLSLPSSLDDYKKAVPTPFFFRHQTLMQIEPRRLHNNKITTHHNGA